MKLTGKCLKSFKKWLINKAWTSDQNIFTNYTERLALYKINNFEQLPPSMKYGVLVDFFDSVGISISMNDFKNEFEWDILIYKSEKWWDCDKSVETRHEARKQSILKANEIYNKQP